MVGKAGIAISIVLVILSLIAVGISFIYLSGSYQKMTRANENAKNSCIELRDANLNELRALQRVWQYPEIRSQVYVDKYNRDADDFNNGSCISSYGLTRLPHFTANG